MGRFVFPYLIGILLSIGIVCATDYCRPELCENVNGARHIGCGNNGLWGPNCYGRPVTHPMTARMRALILEKHNIARNKIALGLVPGYLSANKMLEMSWSKELENIAMFNVKTCMYGHNPCSNTDKHRYVGQNIAMRMYSKNYVIETTDVTISSFIDLWFNEYVNCSMSYINNYRPNETVKIGHFTQIVQSKANRIGCAAATFPTADGYLTQFYLVCNYSFGNVIGEPTYTVGRTTSRCKFGRSMLYKGLCNTKRRMHEVKKLMV